MGKKASIEIGKWHFKLGIISTYWDNFGYMVHFGFFKPISFPAEGQMITKENYKGFWFRKVIRIRGFELSFSFEPNAIRKIFEKYFSIK